MAFVCSQIFKTEKESAPDVGVLVAENEYVLRSNALMHKAKGVHRAHCCGELSGQSKSIRKRMARFSGHETSAK